MSKTKDLVRYNPEEALDSVREKYALAIPGVGRRSLESIKRHGISLETITRLEDIRDNRSENPNLSHMIYLCVTYGIEPHDIQFLYELRDQQSYGEEISLESMAKAFVALNRTYDLVEELMEKAIEEWISKLKYWGKPEDSNKRFKLFLNTRFNELVEELETPTGCLTIFSDCTEGYIQNNMREQTDDFPESYPDPLKIFPIE